MNLVQVKDLDINYQVRRITKGRSWYQALLKPEIESRPVLRGVNFLANGVGITAILGSNGAGKTTLLKTLSGILTPTAGEVKILGFNPAKRSRKMLQQLGVIFGQKKMLWDELSLRENFTLTGSIYRIAKTTVEDRESKLIKLLDLTDLCDRPIKTLSLGEAMQAEIANILLFQPKLIFMDEPTIGLDLAAQKSIRQAIRTYVEEIGSHVLLTSHNLRDISELADDIWFLENGQMAQIDRRHLQGAALEQHLEERLVQP